MFGHSFRRLCTVSFGSIRRPHAVPLEIGLFKTTLKSPISIIPQSMGTNLMWDSALRDPEPKGEVSMELDSVMRKRKKKMKKHKLRKRRKREKAEKRKLSQGR